MRARIFQPPKSAMQSGRPAPVWVLQYESDTPNRADPVMGWIGGADTRTQLRLTFSTLDAATAHAKEKGLDYEVEQPRARIVRPRAYADNFGYTRHGNWTH